MQNKTIKNNRIMTNKTMTNKTMTNKTMKIGSGGGDKWPYIPLSVVNELEKIADYYNISHKARGLQKPTKSDDGFLSIYRKNKGNPSKFENLPVKKSIPQGENWKHHREDFCNRRYAMIKGKLGSKQGLYNPETGLPSVMHTNMLMWACSPDLANVIKNKDLYITKLKKLKDTKIKDTKKIS